VRTLFGAGGRTRTGTLSPAVDFESFYVQIDTQLCTAFRGRNPLILNGFRHFPTSTEK